MGFTFFFLYILSSIIIKEPYIGQANMYRETIVRKVYVQTLRVTWNVENMWNGPKKKRKKSDTRLRLKYSKQSKIKLKIIVVRQFKK